MINIVLASILSLSLIFYSSGSSDYNTIPPLEYVEMWNRQASFGSFTGTPISPYHFLTVQHIEVQNNITVGGVVYPIVGYYDDWNSNLRLYKIKGRFSNYVELYDKNDEKSKKAIIFGRGVNRNVEIRLNGELKGWTWDNKGNGLKWGENIIEDIVPSFGGDVLKWSFNLNKNLPALCSLSVGDSGGGVFIKDENKWKLAGVNFAVENRYGINNLGNENEYFLASIFDENGLYKFDGFTWYKIEENTSTKSYAIRVSSRLHWIRRVVEWSSPPDVIMLQSADNPKGLFVDEMLVLTDNNEVIIPIPQKSKCYRLSASEKLKIISIEIRGDRLVIRYVKL